MKDEIQKGTFQLEFDIQSTHVAAGQPFNDRIRLFDLSGSTGYHVNSPAGEYGILYAYTSTANATGQELIQDEAYNDSGSYAPCGLIYYQAGVAVISGSVFNQSGSTGGILKVPGSGIASAFCRHPQQQQDQMNYL